MSSQVVATTLVDIGYGVADFFSSKKTIAGYHVQGAQAQLVLDEWILLSVQWGYSFPAYTN